VVHALPLGTANPQAPSLSRFKPIHPHSLTPQPPKGCLLDRVGVVGAGAVGPAAGGEGRLCHPLFTGAQHDAACRAPEQAGRGDHLVEWAVQGGGVGGSGVPAL